MFKFNSFVLALSCAIIAVPAIAGETVDPVPAKPDHGGDPRTGDPDRIICRREKLIGSRLGTNRRCMTATEWATQRQLDRDSVEHGQMYTPTREK